MTEITKAQQVTLGNFTEHLRTVKVNIQDAVKELEGVLSKKDTEKALLDALMISRAQLADEVATLRAQRASLLEGNKEESTKLDERKVQLEADITAFESYKTAQAADMESRHQQYLLDCNEVLESIAELHREHLAGKDKLAAQEARIEALRAEINSLEKTSAELQKEVLGAERTAEKQIAACAKEVKQAERELAIAQEAVEIEKAKVVIPRENLLREQRILEEKQKNLLILTTRFQNKFEKVFPGQKVII